MKNWKKLLSLGLAVVLSAGVLTGCGSKEETAADASATEATETTDAADGTQATETTSSTDATEAVQGTEAK